MTARPSLLCLLVAGIACGGGAAPRSAPAPASGGPVPLRLTRVPDANTAAILLMSHNVVLAAARLAPSRAQHRDVKLLARSLVTDHSTMSSTLSRVLAAADITPREDDVTRLLRDQSVARRDTLRALSGWAFDSAYVEQEVRYHQDLLVAIDRVFVPSVRNAQLREYVSAIRPTVVGHLTLAEQVRDAIMPRR